MYCENVFLSRKPEMIRRPAEGGSDTTGLDINIGKLNASQIRYMVFEIPEPLDWGEFGPLEDRRMSRRISMLCNYLNGLQTFRMKTRIQDVVRLHDMRPTIWGRHQSGVLLLAARITHQHPTLKKAV
jgi:hypothetical protein